MSLVDPMDLEFSYSLQYRGIPHPDHEPSDYPLRWTVTATIDVYPEDDDDDADPETHPAASAVAYLIPEAGVIDLIDTMDAVSSELTDIAGHLVLNRPDLILQLDEARPDLLVLSALEVEEDLRGQKIGYTVFNAILETVGRSAGLVVLKPAPILSDVTPKEGSPAHQAETAALRRYWEGFGCYDIGGGYMAFGGVEGLVQDLGDEGFLGIPGYNRP